MVPAVRRSVIAAVLRPWELLLLSKNHLYGSGMATHTRGSGGRITAAYLPARAYLWTSGPGAVSLAHAGV